MAKSYRVVGGHVVDGHAPGEEYTADYSPERERFLVEAGHIQAVQAAKQDKAARKGVESTPVGGEEK